MVGPQCTTGNQRLLEDGVQASDGVEANGSDGSRSPSSGVRSRHWPVLLLPVLLMVGIVISVNELIGFPVLPDPPPLASSSVVTSPSVSTKTLSVEEAGLRLVELEAFFQGVGDEERADLHGAGLDAFERWRQLDEPVYLLDQLSADAPQVGHPADPFLPICQSLSSTTLIEGLGLAGKARLLRSWEQMETGEGEQAIQALADQLDLARRLGRASNSLALIRGGSFLAEQTLYGLLAMLSQAPSRFTASQLGLLQVAVSAHANSPSHAARWCTHVCAHMPASYLEEVRQQRAPAAASYLFRPLAIATEAASLGRDLSYPRIMASCDELKAHLGVAHADRGVLTAQPMDEGTDGRINAGAVWHNAILGQASQGIGASDRLEHMVALTQLVLAMRRFEAEQDLLPPTLDALVPRYLDAPVLDPWTGASFGWDDAQARLAPVDGDAPPGAREAWTLAPREE